LQNKEEENQMEAWIGELIGTAILIFLGTAVVANVVLKDTKGHGSGLIVIAAGWAMAVMVPAIIFGEISGAHFNPALTIGLAVAGDFSWSDVPLYIIGQFVGAILGGGLTWLFYRDHFNVTEDQGAQLGVFSTGPAIRNTLQNFISEFLATFILVFAIMGLGNQPFADGLNFFGVGGIILAIGVSLGGTTGYAINPARDLGPRIAHFLLPMKNKGNSDWSYAWIPVVAPIAGGIVAALLANALF